MNLLIRPCYLWGCKLLWKQEQCLLPSLYTSLWLVYYSTFRDKQLIRVSWNVKNKMSFLGGAMENAMDGGAWWAAVHGVAKSWTRLSDFTFTFHFHALEKKMATHSSVLAWTIPGTGEPGGLAVYGVTESRTRLKRLSSSSSRYS